MISLMKSFVKSFAFFSSGVSVFIAGYLVDMYQRYPIISGSIIFGTLFLIGGFFAFSKAVRKEASHE